MYVGAAKLPRAIEQAKHKRTSTTIKHPVGRTSILLRSDKVQTLLKGDTHKHQPSINLTDLSAYDEVSPASRRASKRTPVD